MYQVKPTGDGAEQNTVLDEAQMAWALSALIYGAGVCIPLSPGRILSHFNTAHIPADCSGPAGRLEHLGWLVHKPETPRWLQAPPLEWIKKKVRPADLFQCVDILTET